MAGDIRAKRGCEASEVCGATVSLGRASFLDFALHGGGSSNSTSRTINNITIASGIEIATASYSSSYISPELKYGVNIPLWTQYTLTPSVRLRYVAGFFGEAGHAAPASLGASDRPC